MLFDRRKYIALFIALILLILGFALMSGPENNQVDYFDTEIFNFRRITIAPLLITGTYAGILAFIVKRPCTK